MQNPQLETPTPSSAYGASSARGWDWRRSISPTGNTGDAIFRTLLLISAVLLIASVAAMIVAMAVNSLPSIKAFGASFLAGRVWNPIQNQFGALPFIYGTIVSSLLALAISVPLSLGIAIFSGRASSAASCAANCVFG
ncbi:MAG: hypothetical protein WKF84_21180 [Pyrinomonadaceae bacterium]